MAEYRLQLLLHDVLGGDGGVITEVHRILNQTCHFH